jgi:hypothetical protein
MKKLNLSTIGLLQASGLTIYCSLIVGILSWFEKGFFAPPGFLGLLLMLVLLVFSAAVTGSIVFGYSAYLFLKHKKTKEPLSILAFTLLYCLAIIMIIAILIAALA